MLPTFPSVYAAKSAQGAYNSGCFFFRCAPHLNKGLEEYTFPFASPSSHTDSMPWTSHLQRAGEPLLISLSASVLDALIFCLGMGGEGRLQAYGHRMGPSSEHDTGMLV